MSNGMGPRAVWSRPGAGALLWVLTACLPLAGCAGWNATGGSRSAWMSPFWKRASRPADPAGYDLYADAAGQSRPVGTATRESLASRSRPATPARGVNSAGEALARTERSSEGEGRAAGRKSGTKDASIRVTLGRPESLPTLRDPAEVSGPMLAAAPSTNWKRAEAAAPPRRSAPARADDPSREPRQRPRGELAAGSATAAPRPPTGGQEKLRKLLAETRARLDAIPTYQVEITRLERVGGQLQAEEDVVLNVRREPKAVLLQWVKGPSKGREVIYSTALDDRMIHVNMGNSSLPLPRMSIPVDSPLVMRNSRHPISEAGLDTIVDNLVKHVESSSVAARAEGTLVYKGIEQPKDVDHPCHRIERVTPQGETWEVYLDTRTLMPALVLATQTSSGELIERYVYRNFKPNPGELASADAFDPDKRWGESKSLFSRLARAVANPDAQAKPAPTTTR